MEKNRCCVVLIGWKRMYGIYIITKSSLLRSDGSLEASVWTAESETLGNKHQRYITKGQRWRWINNRLREYFEKNYPLLIRLNHVADMATILVLVMLHGILGLLFPSLRWRQIHALTRDYSRLVVTLACIAMETIPNEVTFIQLRISFKLPTTSRSFASLTPCLRAVIYPHAIISLFLARCFFFPQCAWLSRRMKATLFAIYFSVPPEQLKW